MCVCVCVLEQGTTPRHSLFCRVPWCHPPTTPLCFHTSVSHTTPDPLVGRCAYAGPNGRYFEVGFCLCLCLLKEFSVGSCTLQTDRKDHSTAQLWRGSSCVNPLRSHLSLYYMERWRTMYMFISSRLFISNKSLRWSLHGACAITAWIPMEQTWPCSWWKARLVKCCGERFHSLLLLQSCFSYIGKKNKKILHAYIFARL